MQNRRIAWVIALSALSASLGLHFGCGGDDTTTPLATTDGGGGDSNRAQFTQGFELIAPLDGELAEPGATIDVVVGTDGLTPRLFIADEETTVTWTPDPTDPTILHASYTVPASPGDLQFLVTADGAMSAYAKLHVAAPKERMTATLATDPDAGDGGSTDTVLSLPSGATLRVPVGSVQGGGGVTFASFAPTAMPEVADPVVDSFYRVHFDAEDTAVHFSIYVTQPISAQVVSALSGGLELRVIEPEGSNLVPNEDLLLAPVVVRATLVINPDGTGLASALLPPDAFHHTGSSTAIYGLFPAAQSPYLRSATSKVCVSNDDEDGGTVNCGQLADLKGKPPTIGLSGAGDGGGAHVKITSDLTWADSPPDIASPVSTGDPVLRSPMNPLRETCRKGADKVPCPPGGTLDSGVVLSDSRFRPHEGADIGASMGDAILAPVDGNATLTMTGSFYVDLIADTSPKYMFRMMHVSDFTADYAASLDVGAVLGKKASCTPNKKKKITCDVLAPQKALYGLSCVEATIKGAEKLICHPTMDGVLLGGADFCIGAVERGIYKAHFTQGSTIGKVGSTGLPFKAPHVHMEVHYKMATAYTNATAVNATSRGAVVDPALFYSSLSSNPWVQGGDTNPRVQSPTLELAAELTPGDGTGPIAGNLIGIDPVTLKNAMTAACPYGGTIDSMNYQVVKVGGPKEKTTVAWDLGPCVYAEACNKGLDVTLQLGTASFRNDNHGTGRPWTFMGSMPSVSSYPPDTAQSYTNPPPKDVADLADPLTAIISCKSSGAPQPADFEGMTVTVQATGEFATSTMTITNVTLVGSPSQYLGSANGPEAGNPMLLSQTVPANATVFSFIDKLQSAGVAGFPSVFNNKDFANRFGRSNLIAVWQDNAKKWQWAFNVSGGSYNSGGGFPQWHEYQFVYNSLLMGNAKNRYDVFLGGNAMAGNWSYIRTLATSVAVTRKKTGYILPDATMK